MTTDSDFEMTTVSAGADLTGADKLFKAVAVGGTIAATNAAALGLLRSKGKSGESVSVAYAGEMKAYAGAAITAGDRVSITTSGFTIVAVDSRSTVGRALETAASGDLYRGLFNFASNN